MSRVTYDHLVRLIRRRIAATPDGVAMRYKVGAEWRGDHLRPSSAPAHRRRRVLAHRRRRPPRRPRRHLRREHAVVDDRRPRHAGGRRHHGSHLPDQHRPPGRAHRPRRRREDRLRRRRRAVRAPRRRAGTRRPDRARRRRSTPGIALDLTDSCPMSVPLAHPVSPDLVDPRRRPPALDDVATIIYTSGTTGEPEGRRPHVREPGRAVRGARPVLLGHRAGPVALLPAAQPRLRAGLDLLRPLPRGAELLPRGSEARHRRRCRRCGRPAW